MIALDRPLWLLGLVAIPLVLVLGRSAVAAVRPRQHRAATLLRAGAVALLVLALAGLRWERAGEAVDVAFLVDDSDSVGIASGEALTWVRDAVAGMRPEDRAALALFGNDARIEHTLRADPPLDDVATVVDGSGTDIERALRLGQGVLGGEQRRRVIVFTDGRPTEGDALRTARELAEAGIAVDVVPLAAGRAADVLLASVDAPSRVREGEAFDLITTVRNTGTTPAEAVLVATADGEIIDRRTIAADPGDTEVRLPQTADRGGTVRYEVRLSSGGSTVVENDVGRAAVQVDGPPQVLVFEGTAGDGSDLAAALESAGVHTVRMSADQEAFPPLDRLLDYETVLLVDVAADVLGPDGMVTLDTFVRDAGHGLVAIGGPTSFGMGGYDGTTLEELLPVFARVKDPERRPSVAEALVVDVSGSMAACHCRPDGFAGGTGMAEEGGVNKTDITREAIARAVRALEAQDTVGVLAFNAQSEWVVPLQQLPDEAVVDAALAQLHPDGPTDVVTALNEAVAGLKDQQARLRHIVLFTDGFSEDPAMVDAARNAAENGITLSVVATGEGTGEVLRRMAEAGGGRFYPGRDLFSIPDIIVSEVQFAARPIINEGSFAPVVTGIDAPTEGLDAAPPLRGYLSTTEKPTARTLLRIGDERDPLLATWQAGLGRAAAWTSDVAPRWSAAWVGWERYATFWADVVRSTFPAAPDPRFALAARATTEGILVEVASADTIPAETTGTATITAPDGSRQEVELTRTDLVSFAAEVAGGAQGIYSVAVRLQHDGTDLFRDAVTAIRSYSPEYASNESDPGFLARLAEAGGGRLDPSAETAFTTAGLVPGSSTLPLWPLLALLALLTLPADVGLRRLRLEREDWSRFRRWARDRFRGGGTGDGEASSTEHAAGRLLRSRRASREGGGPPGTGGPMDRGGP